MKSHPAAAVVLGLAVLAFPMCRRDPFAQPRDPGLEERREVILNALSEQTWKEGDDIRRRIYLAIVKIHSGRDRETGLRYLRDAVAQPSPFECFQTYAAMEAILRLGDRLPPDLVEQLKARIAAGFTMDLGFTENHKLQFRTARYLFGQTWPDGPRFADGMTPTEGKKEAEAWIDDWIERTITLGQYEYDSPNYASLYFLCLTSLKDFSQDPNLRRKAWMMLHLLLADYATLYLEGNWTGGHSREKYDQVTHTSLNSGTANPFGYLYFGRSVYHPEIPEQYYIGLAAAQGFTPHPLIGRIAADRTRPFFHRETKAPRRGMGVNQGTLPIWKYTFVTADYALGSSYGDLTDVENHRWDLTWVSKRDGATSFFINPYFSKAHLLSYFADDPDKIEANILRQRPYADSPEKWVEGSPYEQLLQHENTLIALYDIPSEARFGHVNGFFPKILEAREEDPSGWIFARADRVFFAVRPFTPGVWTEKPDHFRLTLDNRKTGLIFEAASSAEYASFTAFRDRIRKNPLEIDLENLRVRYTTSKGIRLEFGPGERRVVDDNPVDFAAWPLYEGPFLNAKKGSRIFVISHGGEKLVLDFNKFSVR